MPSWHPLAFSSLSPLEPLCQITVYSAYHSSSTIRVPRRYLLSRGFSGFAWTSTRRTRQLIVGILSEVLLGCFKICSHIFQGSRDAPHPHSASNPEPMTVMYFPGVGHCFRLGKPMAFGALPRKDQAFTRINDYYI